LEIRDIRSTDLFAGTEQRPLQLLSATLVNRGVWMASGQQAVTVRAEGPGVTTPEPAVVAGPGPGETVTVEVPVSVDPSYAEGTTRSVTVIAEGGRRPARAAGELVVAGTGWTMFMVPHFHYDPVWWNTQAGYAVTWDDLPAAQERRMSAQHPVFHLVRAHLDAARRDSDYKFVLAELDYLKPYWDARPEDRAEIAELISAGRIELVGGMYNEPNTNLTSLEGTIRNTIYGVGYQRGVLGGDPRTGWMLDVFGHDPSYPAVMADAGLTSSSWARGPFHQWGPHLTVGDSTRMQFPSEFEWVAPDGRGLLTSYMASHYSAGWQLSTPDTLAEAEAEALALFRDLKAVAATRNVLLPVGADHVIPSRWATEIQRDWNKRYLWPRFVVGLPAEFFAAVRSDAARRNISFPPQSRDMNPVYTGKDVSYIDTKQAHRAAETMLADAEKLATLATTLLGARYPAEAVDKAWRQLCFNAHHDAITGTESDQVYLDLLGGWREAHELAAAVRDTAVSRLAQHVDTRGDGQPLIVINTQSWPRTDIACATASFEAPGPAGAEVRDAGGRVVPAVVTAERRHGDGTLAEATLSFVAADVPATGYLTYRLCGTDGPGADGWRPLGGAAAESGAFLVEADPGRGGALTRIRDKRTGKELVPPGEVANELVCHDEYPEHPEFGEGPWHLVPTGTRRGTSAGRAAVRAEVSAAGQRLIATCQLDGLTVTQEVTCWEGLTRLEFRTHVDGSIGRDRLLRARFPLAVAGARPVHEVGNAAIGRTFGFPDTDAAAQPWTLDNPAHNWAGLSATVRVAFTSGGGIRARHAVGVAEIVADGPVRPVRDLVTALAQQGVTATTSRPDGPRYGSLDVDSNLPDTRLSIGGPEDNAFTARVLESADGRYASSLARQLAATGQARVWVPAARDRAATWVPGADLRGPRDLPVLIVAGRDGPATAAAVTELAGDLADATIDVTLPAGPDAGGESADGTAEPAEDYSAALLNRGIPSAVIEPSGTLHLSLMRSCSGWPSGIWIDPPRRSAPDGSSFQWQHWSHTFEYALACGAGDWRDAGFVHAGHAYNHPFQAHLAGDHDGGLPPSASLLEVEPAGVVLTALKPSGDPPGTGEAGNAGGGAGTTVLTFRCYETSGRAVRARIRYAVPLRDGVLTNILDEPQAPLETAGGALAFEVGPAATVTAAAVPAAGMAAGGPDGAGADGAGADGAGDHARELAREPAEPVFARYWLHNKGAAPVGGLPVSVVVEPAPADATGGTTMRVTVAATQEASGQVDLVTPPGLHATVPDGGLRYHLPAGGHQDLSVTVRPDGAPPGIYHVAARITGPDGQAVEDVATLSVAHGSGASAEPGTAEPGTAELGTAEPGTVELSAAVEPAELVLPPGGTGELRARLTSHCQDAVRGEAQLISPFGTWELAGPWTQGFTVPAGGQQTLTYRVRIPHDARPMAAWLLVKVMANGRADYTAPVALTVSG
jgi:alpha-mannosidase